MRPHLPTCTEHNDNYIICLLSGKLENEVHMSVLFSRVWEDASWQGYEKTGLGDQMKVSVFASKDIQFCLFLKALFEKSQNSCLDCVFGPKIQAEI